MVEIPTIGHYCPACKGEGVITLELHYPVTVEPENVPDSIPPDYKRYPCPECQKTFYHNDIQVAEAHEQMQIESADRDEYIKGLKERVARHLAHLMTPHIQFTTLNRQPSDFDALGFGVLSGRLRVVKLEAVKRYWK